MHQKQGINISKSLDTSFQQGSLSNWILHTTNTIEIPLNFENRTTDGRVMAKYVLFTGQKINFGKFQPFHRDRARMAPALAGPANYSNGMLNS